MDSANGTMAVEEQRLTEWRMARGPYLGDISALCFLHLPNLSLPLLLAGLGSEITVYDLELSKRIRSFSAFQGVRVHGIASCLPQQNVIAVFGETRVKLFSFVFYSVSRSPEFTLVHLLPKFGHWVLDVCFLKGPLLHSNVETEFLAVGCSDNSVHVWDISNSNMILKVQSPVRCLLYSMRLRGHNLEVLRIASGTIFNEIIVWKVAAHHKKSSSHNEKHDHESISSSNCCPIKDQLYEAIHVCKLIGHEGSIFRIAWSSCGSKLVSVSDDRSARVWAVAIEREHSLCHNSTALVLFGHNARVWDCCITDDLIVTVSEDCTCHIWGVDGKQLQVIKEHIGRGIWRCLYDPNSSLLITAGFDSAIKVHQPHASLPWGLEAAQGSPGRTEMFSICIPNVLDHIGFMDSKSEYVRCLRFSCQDSLYVATNRGYLYHAKLCDTGGVQWSQLVQVSNGAPIICMDLLSKNSFELDCGAEDWIAIGDGKGNMTIIGVVNSDCTPTVRLCFTWPAEMERQLLGNYWCKSLGCRYVFTADPRGKLKLWRLPDPSQSDLQSVSCIAEFISSYGMRVMCLDACMEEEVLACGDVRGNMVLFPLLKKMVLGISAAQEMKIPPVNNFKGVHGISSVSSVSVTKLGYNQIEICSTGADGCICYLEYDKEMQNLLFTGMKQVKELSLIEYVSVDNNSGDKLSSSYAAGFASVDFIIWNLVNENKVVNIPCGGWRRPHSYYLGDIPETKNCFAFVKDEMIHIHRHWIHNRDGKVYPQSLHMQFHGREIHSLCFVSDDVLVGDNSKCTLFSKSSWIATGCEDGTVRLTWYSPGIENWSTSKLLGEHVGGSAVRSICCVSTVYSISSYTGDVPDGGIEVNAAFENNDNPTLLISVGAKRVLTSWILKNRRLDNKNDFITDDQCNSEGVDDRFLSNLSSSRTFQWLSTDMPAKYSITQNSPGSNVEKVVGVADNVSNTNSDARVGSLISDSGMANLIRDKCEDDWRYLAVTAFLVKCSGSRISVCFVVVACSDATLVLRALILPFRLWFDVALLVPLLAPVLSLQHIIFRMCRPHKENIQVGNVYIVISGSTDGSVAFWDLTDSVEAFMQRVSVCNVEKFFDCQKRPRTGRGSQGGRQWRSIRDLSKRKQDRKLVTSKADDKTQSISGATQGTSYMPSDSEDSKMVSSQSTHTAPLELESKTDNSSVEISEIQPLHLLQSIHQSGVNCLHVSEIKGGQNNDSCHVYSVVSGGDDQALHHLMVELSPKPISSSDVILNPDITHFTSVAEYEKDINLQSQSKNYKIRFLNYEKLPSAHSSSVKGVWTDGSWVFSTGLDQRVRCWHLQQNKLIEHSYLIVSVPEPEALSARACGRNHNHYQIAVAGRGMQIIDFSESQ